VATRSYHAASWPDLAVAESGAVRYLRCGEQRIFSVHHAATEPGRSISVLLCAPFGWEAVSSHRILREWSLRLAAAGISSLRWTLPGFGDSTGSPQDEGLFDTWVAATDTAARWLREATGDRPVVAIGLGLGGTLAYRAASEGAPIDGFVLWGAACRGRDVVRQMRAFSRMESSEFFLGVEPPAPLEEGSLEVGGFLLTPSTVESLYGLDLSAGGAPPAPLGVLMLERDGLPVDERLLGALDSAGIETRTSPGAGYADMTSHPQKSVVPEAVFTEVAQWLHTRSEPARAGRAALPPFESEIGHKSAAEGPFEMQTPEGTLRGIAIRTAVRPAPLCAVFLNAGAQYRIGPNRMWTEAARRWASQGIASLRLDMLGIGESDGEVTPYTSDMTLYEPEFQARVTAVLDELERADVAGRFVLIGLCAGAYWALHGGVADDRVAGIMMLNPAVVVWDDHLGGARDLRRVFTDRSWRLIRKNATPQRLRGVARMLMGVPFRYLARRLSPGGELPSLEMRVEAHLALWEDPRRRIAAWFAQREGLAMDLERGGTLARLGSLSHVTIGRLPVNDHTVRPVAVQRLVHRELDAELQRVLAGPASDSFSPPGARGH
jgi:alpha-beta hydrolase superfamily lysophospholipase